MMHAPGASDAFLDQYVTNDEVLKRCLSEEDFNGSLDNEMNDVPLQDMYNRGLALTQQGRERTNLQLEGTERCGLTGFIPSMEEGLAMGAAPKPKALVLDLGAPPAEEKEMSLRRRGLKR